MPGEMLFFSSLNTHGPLSLGLLDYLQQLAVSTQPPGAERGGGAVVWFTTFATEAEEVAQPLNPGNEVRSVHFLPLLSVTGPVKGFMARI